MDAMTTLQSDIAGVVWVSISDLAKRKGIHRQSAKERVDRLVSKGLIQTRTDGRSRMVDLAAYDRATSDTGDQVREEAAAGRREPDAAASPKLRDAQTERAQYEARLKALDLAERTGILVPIKGEHGVEQAMIRAAEAIVRAIDQIPSWANEIAAASKDGEPAIRRELRKKRDQLRRIAADALSQIAGEGAAEEADGGIEVSLTEED
jgi:DNA-binding MarR family transcriptional regulator